MANQELDDDLIENINNEYKYGFEMVTEAILNGKHNYKASLEDALKIAMDFMCASSISLYRRVPDSNLFNRHSSVSSISNDKYLNIADSCIVGYINRIDRKYENMHFTINYPKKETQIDILPIETFGQINNIVIITDNDLTRPELFNDVIQKSLKTVLTNMELIDELERSKVEDSLTGIKNREGYYHRITQLFKNGTPEKLTFTIADLFRLKKVNDQISHIAGDDYIKNCAEALHTYFRRKDGNHIYRIGGDEFIILSEEYDAKTVSQNIKKSNTVLRKLMRGYLSKHRDMDFMINYGSAEISDEIRTPQDLYRTADNALSENKKKIYLEAGYERRR